MEKHIVLSSHWEHFYLLSSGMTQYYTQPIPGHQKLANQTMVQLVKDVLL